MYLVPASATHTSALALGAGTLSAPINTETAITIPQGHFAGGLRTQFVKFNQLSDDQLLRLREEDPEADLHSTESLLSTSLLLAYGLSENFTVGLRLPFVKRDDMREPPHHEEGGGHGHEEESAGVEKLGSASGIGDLVVFGQFRFLHWQHSDTHAALLLGVKTPSGSTSEKSRGGEKLEAELQPGSGSWDGIFGLSFTQNFSPVTINSSLVYTVVTEGTQDTDLGDVFNYNLAVSYRLPLGGGRKGDYFFLGEGGIGVDLILEYNGQWRDKTRVGSRSDGNSGGSLGYISPGVRVLLGRHTSVNFSYGHPVVDALNGDQDNVDYRLVGSVNFYF